MSNQSKDRKISQFLAQTSIPSDAQITYISGSVNYRISLADFLTSIGVTGTIVQDGDPLGTPVLDTAGSVNNIRNIEDGPGIKSSVSAQNGIDLEHNFQADIVGAQLVNDLTLSSPTFRSLVAGSGINVAQSGNEIQIALSAVPASTKTVIVNSISDFPAAVAGVITLAGDTEYAVRNDITTANRFVLGSGTVLSGSDNLVISLSYTGSGTMFTSASKSWTVTDITLNCTSGTLLSFAGTGAEILQLKDTVINVDTLGTISDFAGIHFEDNQITIATNGLVFSGTNGVILVDSSLATIAAGTFFDLVAATFTGFSITDGFYTLNGTSVFLDGAASSANIASGGLGTVHNCRFFGAGTPLQTIGANDIRWGFFINDKIFDTHQDCLMSQVGNLTETVITVVSTPVKLAGTWTAEHEDQFTGDATGKMTYNGIKDINFDITMSFSAAPVSGTNKAINFYPALNGAVISNAEAFNNISSTDPSRTTVIWRTVLSTGDYIEAFAENDTDTINIIVTDAVMRIS
jgi:hypothetical protein